MADYEMKQVIVLRKDLKMRKGKMIAQGAHASLKAIMDEGAFHAQDSQANDPFVLDMSYEMEKWFDGDYAKICVSVDSEKELLHIFNEAIAAGMHCSLIQDKGFTEFKGVPTYTAVAVGPARVEEVNKITGELKLL